MELWRTRYLRVPPMGLVTRSGPPSLDAPRLLPWLTMLSANSYKLFLAEPMDPVPANLGKGAFCRHPHDGDIYAKTKT